MQDEAQTAIPKILLVDDNEREAENAKTWFEMAFEGLQLHFILQNPSDLPGVSDYVKYIDALPVSALLIDHRLNESASANYTGLELADFYEICGQCSLFLFLQNMQKTTNWKKEVFL